MRQLRSFIALATAFLAAGCESDPRDACEPPSKPKSFEVGTGETCFERVNAGASIPMMAGPQGGFHLWLAIGCTDCGAKPRVDYRLVDPQTGEDLPGTSGLTSRFAELYGDEWPQSAGLQVPMPGSEWAEEEGGAEKIPEGTAMRIEVAVYDAAGKSVIHQESLEVVLGAIEYWSPCDSDPDACENNGDGYRN